MKIAEAQDRAAKAARLVKEHHVARVRGDEGTDIMTFVEGYRGEEAVVTCGLRPDRDAMLTAMTVIATAFSADVVAATMETFHADVDKSPVTGASWEAGEMSKVAAEHDGIAKGWVHEALVTQVANRAGDQAGVIQPYVIRRMGRRVTVRWLDMTRSQDLDGAKMEGMVPRAISDIMGRPTLEQVMLAKAGLSGADFGLTEEETRADQDLAGLNLLRKVVGDQLVTVALPVDPHTLRGKIIEERLREASRD